MKSRMYWGVATLIVLLIGVSVFLLTRSPETEPEIIYDFPTPEKQAEVRRNIQDAIDKGKTTITQPGDKTVSHGDDDHAVPLSTEIPFPKTRAEFEALTLEEQEALKQTACLLERKRT